MYKNKALREQLLNDGFYDQYRKFRSDLFRTGQDYHVAESILYAFVMSERDEDTLDECKRISASNRKQRKRCYSHLDFIFRRYDLNRICFATFTIDDDHLFVSDGVQIQEDTFRQHVQRILSNCTDYALNIDYGGKNGRIHFHAVIVLNEPSLYQVENTKCWHSSELDSYRYGFYYLEPIRDIGDSRRVANYLNKLVNHSIKITGQRISYKKNSEYSYWCKHIKTFFGINM